jgi:integrase
MLSFAVSEGVIAANPARGAKRPADNHRVRRLSAEEYRQLGKALADAETDTEASQGIADIWLLALTACRSGEIINLNWEELMKRKRDQEGSCLRLTESKEGASVRPAGRSVFEILTQIEKKKDCPYVLVPVRGDGPFGGMARAWQRTIKRAQLAGVTPHMLKHSYASVAGDLGFTESAIAALLGHAAGSVTSRYVHHLDSVLVAAADKVAGAIHVMMTTDATRSTKILHRRVCPRSTRRN